MLNPIVASVQWKLTTMSLHSYIDLAFPVHGQSIARDHGYVLYAAMSRLVPGVHGATWIGIHGIAGRRVTPEALMLAPMATLRVRPARMRF